MPALTPEESSWLSTTLFGEFKAQVVLEILKEEKSISQLSSEYGVHPKQLSKWKNQALSDLPRLFSDDHKKTEAVKTEYEKRVQGSRPTPKKDSNEAQWSHLKF